MAVGREALGDQRGVRQRAGADGHVVAVLLQVDLPVVQVHLHVDLGKGPHELAQRRSHVAAPETGGSRDLELALGLAHLVVDAGAGRLDLRQDALHVGEEGRALLGDADRSRRAIEQPRRKLILQRLDPLRDRTRSQAELGAHRGQVLHRRHPGKDTHILDVHSRSPTPATPIFCSPAILLSSHAVPAPATLLFSIIICCSKYSSPGSAAYSNKN